ncbi:MAG: membrane protein insertion efficiency factor YidD [Chlamydiota bacterium]
MNGMQARLRAITSTLLLFCCATVFSSPDTHLQANLYYQEPWGEDLALIEKEEKPALPKASSNPIAEIADWIICFHQDYLSPTTCKRSHFRPTSSHYAQRAIKRYGFLQGFLMGCDRLLRENDEKWVYKIIHHEEGVFKYDPALRDKYQNFLDD